MEIHATPEAFRAACDAARAAGRRVGLVPTMGALHDGHLALVDHAAGVGADFRAVTVFVNPLQFGEGEDFGRYPRTLEADLEACRSRGVDCVFTPTPDVMYPPGFATTVSVAGVTERLEGAHRPGHFDGVTTVVAKLFHAAGPCVAVFGRKDYQQWRVLSRMARDLGLPVEVLGHPIVREADGLALSSRNRYLDPEQRRRALGLVQGLRAAADAWAEGERDVPRLEALARGPVEASFDRIDYVAAADPESLAPLPARADRVVLLLAAHLGATRLIDNLELGVDARP
ncbi:MAG: pantoate--beta-alanine ligase [Myxococcota bacterium]